MEVKIKNVLLPNNVLLAPMAGVTNMAYRVLCKKYGAGMVTSEMISDKGIFYHDKKTVELAKIHESEHPIAIQIFGGEIDTMVHAAQFVDTQTNADIIDINMGCPVPKVIKANAGSKYLQDPKRIYEMVHAIVQAVTKPVTVKIRIGWDHDSINVMEVVNQIIAAGASAITIHGRTRSDMYSNTVHYELIKQVKEAHKDFVIIANGDITTPEKAKEVLEYTKADAIMIGRGSFGNPFIFKQITTYLEEGILLPSPTLEEKKAMLVEYANTLVDLKGEVVALKELRGQAGWFIKGCRNGAKFRNQLTQITTYSELIDLLKLIEE